MKRKKLFIFKSTILLFLLFITTSCVEYLDCDVVSNSEKMFLEFYNYNDKAVKPIKWDSVKTYLVESAITQSNESAESKYIVPVDLASDLTQYEFYLDDKKYDLIFRYKKNLKIDNPDCSPSFILVPDTLISQSFDSLAIQVKRLDKEINPHVKIYF